MDIPAHVQQKVLDGFVLDDNGQWARIERMIEKESRFLSHLENGQVMRGDQWVSIAEAKGEAESSGDVEFTPHGDTRAIEAGASSPASTSAEKEDGGSAKASVNVSEAVVHGSSQSRQAAPPAEQADTSQAAAPKPQASPASVRPVSAADNPALGNWETAQSRRRRNLIIVSAGAGLAAAAAVAATVALFF